MSWLSRKKSISARLDIIPAKGAEQISDNLLIHMNAVRAYIKNAFGTDLQGEYQIIVTNDSDGFRAALRDVLRTGETGKVFKRANTLADYLNVTLSM